MSAPPVLPRAADDDHDEDQHVHLRAHLRHHALLVHAPHHAAQPRQRRAHHEHTDKQAADAVAQALDHLAILHTGADQQAHLGARERPGQQCKHRQPHQHGHHAVFLDGGIAQQPATAHAAWQRQGNLRGAPDHLDELFTNDHAAHGDEDLLQVLAIHGPHDEALERQADGPGHRHGHEHRRQHGDHVAPQFG